MSRSPGKNPLFTDLYRSLNAPAFWAYSSWLDIVTKYRRSRFGIVWLVVPSILYVWGIGSFFAGLQKINVGDFVAYVGIGYLLFRMLSMVITESSSVLVAHQAFILDGHVRLTDFVLRVIAKALFYFVMALPVLGVALWIAPSVHLAGLATVVVTFPIVLLNLLWMGCVVSLIGARYQDIHELMGSLFIFGFILTPIIWHADNAPVTSIHGILMRLNPLYHLIHIVRAPIVGEQIHSSTYVYIALMTLAGWGLALVLYRRYARFVALWL